MTSQEALSILDQIAAAAPMSRRDHKAALEAIETLAQAVKPAGDNKDVTPA